MRRFERVSIKPKDRGHRWRVGGVVLCQLGPWCTPPSVVCGDDAGALRGFPKQGPRWLLTRSAQTNIAPPLLKITGQSQRWSWCSRQADAGAGQVAMDSSLRNLLQAGPL